MGRAMQAPDLSSATWQASTTDEQISKAISQGKGRMPPFDMPPPILEGVVKKVRSFKAQ